MTTEQSIPLNRLVPSTANVRRTGRAEGIGELAASIAAHGLRQNLNVMPAPDGRRFAVVAGGRRLKALKQLAKTGQLPKDAPIPCLVLGEDEDAAEISLAENAVRCAMHPDDQCEAFRALIDDKGLSVETVAARFGVTAAVVRQRLKLAAVSPKLRAIYRKGGMTLDQVMALAISDDPAAQERAWADLPEWSRSPAALRRALTEGSVAADDRLAVFVGLDAYVAAGGTVLRDLFDADHEGYLTDAGLLTQLAMAKLDAATETIRAEGWKWVRPELTRDYAVCYGRIACRWPDEDEDDTGEAPVPVFAPEDIAGAGARVLLGFDGSVSVERGLLHPDDVKAETRTARGGKAAAIANGLPATLVENLTAHRTAALRVELARNPAVALAAIVHALAADLLYPGRGERSCFAVRAVSADLERLAGTLEDSPAHQAMADAAAGWAERLPTDPAALFGWCLAQPQETLLDLLAHLAAVSVDAVQRNHGAGAGLAHADGLAGALGLDMTQWWTPSVEGFYGRLSKATLAAIAGEANAPLAINMASTKKPEAARYVAKAMAGTGWLPEVLRPIRDVAADA